MQRSLLRSRPSRSPSRLTKTRTLRTEMLEPRALLSGTDLCWSSGYLAAMLGAGVRASQSVTVADVADTTLLSSSPYANYGNTAKLTVSRDAARGVESQTLLRFNTSQVTGTVSSAILKFTAQQWSSNNKNALLRVRLLSDVQDGWVEGSGGTNRLTTGALTWSNRPQVSGTAITIASAQWPKNGQFSVNVTSLVNQALNQNGLASFVIDIVSATKLQATVVLASREASSIAQRPTLVLNSNVTPTNVAPTVAAVAQAASTTVAGTGTTLSVLGTDDQGEANLKYTWSATAMPSGAAAPTFSANGTNAAKTTNVVFRKVGTYTLTARITDAAGLSVTSALTVTVVSTLSGLRVTPGTATLLPGATQTFAAAGVDQFGAVLAATPSVTWATSAGTITSTGVLTAPATTGALTVTATSGAYQGTATVTVASASFLGLQDAGLLGLTQSLYADGAISRQDMIQILRSVGSDDGLVDAVEFADLKTILANAATLKIASYVEVLARDVVNGNVANAQYQGQALGNLAAGSSASVLTKLVDKWFLGADHPGTSLGSYTLATGTLFVNGVSHLDMYQGQLGDCYYITSLGTIADQSPAAIQNMFIDNGDNTWTVRFYANGVADYVTVDRYLPASSSRLVYANYGALVSSVSTELWMPLAEKAYAQWNETGREGRDGRNLYSSIEAGWMADVYAQVLGKTAGSYSLSYSTSNSVLVNAMTSKLAVSIGTKYTSSGTLSYGLYATHAYAVTGYNSTNGTFTLYNPWGCYQPTSALTWAQLQTVCDWFAVANASGTVPISQTRTPSGPSWAVDEAYAALGQAAHQASTPSSFSIRTATSQDRAAVDLYYQQV